MTDDLKIKVKKLKAAIECSDSIYASDALEYIQILENKLQESDAGNRKELLSALEIFSDIYLDEERDSK